MAEPIEMPFAMWTQLDLGNHVLDGDVPWRQLANTTERSMCNGDAACLLNYFHHLLLLLHSTFSL